MIYKGMIIDTSGYNEGEEALLPSFTQNQIDLINKFIYDNINQTLDFVIHFIIPKEETYEYVSSRIFNAVVENRDGVNVIIQENDLYIDETGFANIRPILSKDTVILIENFTQELCEEFNVPYAEIEV